MQNLVFFLGFSQIIIKIELHLGGLIQGISSFLKRIICPMHLHIIGQLTVEAHIVVFVDFLKNMLYFTASFEPFGLVCVDNILTLIDKHFFLHKVSESLRVKRWWHRWYMIWVAILQIFCLELFPCALNLLIKVECSEIVNNSHVINILTILRYKLMTFFSCSVFLIICHERSRSSSFLAVKLIFLLLLYFLGDAAWKFWITAIVFYS